MTILPTDERSHANGVIDRMGTVPQHVVASTWQRALIEWDSAAAAAGCRVPLL